MAKAGKYGGKVVQAIEKHHQLPQQFIKQFEKVGLDIEEYAIDLGKAAHRLKPNGLHTGTENWNKQWKQFFDKTPDYSKQDVLDQLQKMQK